MKSKIVEAYLSKEKLYGIDFIFCDFERYYKSIIEILNKKLDVFKSNSKNTLRDIDSFIQKEADKPVNKDIEDYKIAYTDYLYSGHFELFNEIAVTFPNNFRNFFLTQIYNFTESELKNICLYLYEKRNILIPFSSFSDGLEKSLKIKSPFERYLMYLTEYAGLKRAAIQQEYIDVNMIRFIRNFIVHDTGIARLTNNNRSLILSLEKDFKLIQLLPLESVNEYEIIIPNDLLINKAIQSSKKLFKKLLEDQLIKVE